METELSENIKKSIGTVSRALLFVTVVMPIRNEIAFITQRLGSVLP